MEACRQARTGVCGQSLVVLLLFNLDGFKVSCPSNRSIIRRFDIPLGHKTATFYINIGINGPGDVAPPNMSHPVVPAFQITGPVNTAYPGTFCLPQVPLVPNVTFNIGDNITIQVIETAQHGAAIYNVSNFKLVSENETDRPAIVRRCDARGSSRRTRSECI